MDRSQVLGQRLLNLARHENISAVLQMAERIETEAPELGIRLDREGESLYLRYGDRRVEIGRRGPSQRVRFAGEFASNTENKPGRAVPLSIPVEDLQRLADYIEAQGSAGNDGPRIDAAPRRPR
jgi:hypothetical protein